MRKITVNKLTQFHHKVCEYLEDSGYLRKQEHHAIVFSGITKYGRIDFTLFQRNEPTYGYSIFAQFKEPCRVPKEFGHNQFSGKYNLHLPNMPVSDAFFLATKYINSVK